eukprot:scaffold25523_cov30-Prasinocladus_malaysianus.AAC.1
MTEQANKRMNEKPSHRQKRTWGTSAVEVLTIPLLFHIQMKQANTLPMTASEEGLQGKGEVASPHLGEGVLAKEGQPAGDAVEAPLPHPLMEGDHLGFLTRHNVGDPTVRNREMLRLTAHESKNKININKYVKTKWNKKQ